MKLLAITDLHGDRPALERILERTGDADVILLGGDITNFGSVEDAESLLGVVTATKATVFAVAGNCDSPAIDHMLAERGVSVFGRGSVHRDVGIYGVSAMPPWMGNMYELSEEEIGAALEKGREEAAGARNEVVLSHPPPRNLTVDRTSGGTHVGSTALRNFIDRVQPILVVCGHIHEARGIDSAGDTTVVNCGPAFDGSYAVIDVDDDVKVQLERA